MLYEKYRDLIPVFEVLNSVYYYPARFNTRMILSVLKELNIKDKASIIDPFAGSGVLLSIASLLGMYSVGIDLLPMIDLFIEYRHHVLKAMISYDKIIKLLDKSLEYRREFIPDKFDFVEKWYPGQVIPCLKRLWGFFHDNIAYYDKSRRKWSFYTFRNHEPVYTIALLSVTRRLSYADDSIAKYYRSRVKRDKIKRLLKKYSSCRELIHMLFKRIIARIRRVEILKKDNIKNIPKPYAIGFTDMVDDYPEIDDTFNVLFTSPPYLIAHEYVRSFKYDLLWLGFKYSDLLWLKKREIPYRDVNYNVRSELFEQYKEKIKDKNKNLLRYYFNYFNALSKVLDKVIDRYIVDKGYIIIIVGDATLAGVQIPIGEIVKEHLSNRFNLRYLKSIKDSIKRRKLFYPRKNNNPKGIKSDYIYIFTKCSKVEHCDL